MLSINGTDEDKKQQVDANAPCVAWASKACKVPLFCCLFRYLLSCNQVTSFCEQGPALDARFYSRHHNGRWSLPGPYRRSRSYSVCGMPASPCQPRTHSVSGRQRATGGSAKQLRRHTCSALPEHTPGVTSGAFGRLAPPHCQGLVPAAQRWPSAPGPFEGEFRLGEQSRVYPHCRKPRRLSRQKGGGGQGSSPARGSGRGRWHRTAALSVPRGRDGRAAGPGRGGPFKAGGQRSPCLLPPPRR